MKSTRTISNLLLDEDQAKVRVKLDRDDDRVMWQTHPQVNKNVFNAESIVGLKNPDKPFPVSMYPRHPSLFNPFLDQDVGVLKWRLQTQEEDQIPLNITCWPNENGDGGCDVSVEYELQVPPVIFTASY